MKPKFWGKLLGKAGLVLRRPSDLAEGRVVVSFPKSGRTWLRVILDELEVPCRYTHDGSEHAQAAPLDELRPAGPQYKGRRVVFLYRDPRDTAVSGFFQATKRLHVFEGDISTFIRSPRHGVEKIARFNKAWLESSPPALRLSYEAMQSDDVAAVGEVLRHLGVSRDAARVARVVEANRFDAMRRREAAGAFSADYGNRLRPGDRDDPESYKVRRGKIGGFSDYLSPEDLAYCREVFDRTEYWRWVPEETARA